MKYHLKNGDRTCASFEFKGDRDDVYEFWLNMYKLDGLTKHDDTFAEFADDCACRCFGGCMADVTHRDCQEGICKKWSKQHE